MRYDARGNLVERRREAKDETGAAVTVVTRFFYDALGRQVASTEPFVEGQTPAGDIRVTHTLLDRLGRSVQTRRLKGLSIMLNSSGAPVYSTSFDASYDQSPTWEADYLLGRSRTVYDDASGGRVAETISETGLRMLFEYDDAGRRTAAITDFDDDGLYTPGVDAKETMAYDAAGRLTSVTDSLGRTTHFQYDALGRVIETIAPDGSVTKTEYDALGRRAAEIDALDRRTEYGYDTSGLLKRVTLPGVDDATTPAPDLVQPAYEYTYDSLGNRTSITDPRGHVTEFTFDEQGRQLTRTLPMGVQTPGDSTDYVENMTYHNSGALSGAIELTVDFADRHVHYDYDDYGRLTSKTFYADTAAYAADEPEQIVTYTYDAFDRVVDIVRDRDGDLGTTADQDATSTDYDRPHTGGARVEQIVIPQGTLAYTYDDLGRQTSVSSSGGTTTDYTYDALNRLEAVDVTERGGVAVAEDPTVYHYDLVGQLDAIANSNGTVTDHVFDAMGRVDEIYHFVDGNGDLIYDASGGGGDTLVASIDYAYNAVGQRTESVEYFDADGDGVIDAASTGEDVHQTFAWTYDNLDRLVEEHYDRNSDGASSEDYIHTFAYDLASNRVEQTLDPGADGAIDETITYAHDNNDRLLTETSDVEGETSYSYNDAGDLLSKTPPAASGEPATHYTYDATGRMVGVDSDDDGVDEVTYTYDAAGVRVTKTDVTASSTTEFLIDPQNPTGYAKPIEEHVDGQLARSYAIGLLIHSQTEHQAGLAGPADTTLYFIQDAAGHTRALLDAAGTIARTADAVAVAQIFTYEAFGDLFSITQAEPLTDWRRADGAHDPQTGFTYHLARWRDGHVFTQMDPFAGDVGFPQSLHKFGFAHNSPIVFTDPSGLFVWQPWLVGIAAHAEIEQIYRRSHLANVIRLNRAIPGTFGIMRPDIRDNTMKHVGEIKPLSPYGLASGPAQLNAYLSVLNGVSVKWRGHKVALTQPFLGGGWVASTWQPQPQRLYLPSKFSNWTVVLLANLNGVILYWAFPNQKNVKLAKQASALMAVKMAEVVSQHVIGTLSPSPGQVLVINQTLNQQHQIALATGVAAGGALAVGAYFQLSVAMRFTMATISRF